MSFTSFTSLMPKNSYIYIAFGGWLKNFSEK